MKTTIATISLSAMLAGLALSAQESPRPAAGGGLEQRFKQLEKSGDGKLTAEEVPGISKWSRYFNGPEWGLDAKGPALFYVKDNAQGTGQLWRAAPPWDKPRLTQLTRDTDIHNWICEPSVSAALPTTRVIVYRGRGPKGGNVDVWLDEDAPDQRHVFTDRVLLARLSADTAHITWAPRLRAGDRTTTQVSLLDPTTGKARVITADEGAKYDPWLWHAPEFDGELLLCVNLDERSLAIYRDTQRDGASPWTRIAQIRLPADAPHPQLKSCEPVNGGRGAFGRSWFTAQGGDDKHNDTSIWLLGFDKNGQHTGRRLDDGAQTGRAARRLDPESYVADRELFVYYTLVGQGPAQLHRCRANIAGNPTKQAGSVSRASGAQFVATFIVAFVRRFVVGFLPRGCHQSRDEVLLRIFCRDG